MEIELPFLPIRAGEPGFKGMEMGLIAGGNRQGAALDLGEALALEMGPDRGFQPPPLAQEEAPVGMVFGGPPGHLKSLSHPAIAPGKSRPLVSWFRSSPLLISGHERASKPKRH